jgi:RNA polymerase sigma factor (sigma-70 family)
MDRKSYTDTEILSGILEHNMFILRYIYEKMSDGPRHFIRSNSGTEDDAADIFQDAMVIVYGKLSAKELTLTSSFKTYLFSVCRNLWLQRIEVKKRMALVTARSGESPGEEDYQPDREWLENEKLNLVQKSLLKLDHDCRRLIRLCMEKISLKEITQIMGFSSVDYTKTRKYMCKNKLKKTIMEDAYFHTIFAYA